MHKIRSVLLVCTGNSCRSIMAEGLLKKYLKKEGKEDIEVKSAGARAIDDMPPTAETIEVMKKEGVDVSGFRSKRLTYDLIKKADLILAMASHHMDEIIKTAPDAAPKAHLLKQYGLKTDDVEVREDPDILDPIGKPISYYERVFETIKKEIERIVKLL
ncbi:MAG: hypothetical protein A3C51_01875 [Omnitrophica bacterium RIFCSPHIGHO2_02_FULL_46_20]|nr:MAG: hypothetical protein A3C51_01875 [Omnitrophica bacterium RIFCSPHIGHO2_02_FULL_46_20]